MADSSGPAAGEDQEQQVTFTVKSGESKYALTLGASVTIGEVKQKLSTPEHADLPPERQRLIYSGRVLKDHDTVGSCKIKDGNTVHLVRGAESNQRQNPANQGGASTPSSAAGQPANNVPSNFATGTGAGNPLAQLTGARYAGFHGLPGADMFGADGGMGAPPNADQMLRMLEDPNFAQQMNEAMNNPAVVDMLRNNPMIRNNPMARQAIENPEFRRMMMNPDMIRMQMQMQRAMGGAEGGQGAFPMPGQTDTTTPSGGDGAAAGGGGAGGAQNATNPAAAPPAGNPFAALFPGAGAGQPQGAGTENAAQANPFAGLFGAGAQQQGSGGAQQNNPMAAMTQQLMQNPQMMQQMMGMMGGNAGGEGGAGDGSLGAGLGGGAGAGAGAGGFNPWAAMGGMGGAAASPPPAQPADDRPPEVRYEDQLRQLNDMGFYEFERNVQALRRSGGSVQGAVEYLLSA
ncbi:hypothetical protein LTR85_005478 [Meristemomyces frigidus]|nr:hypothetical protein LTR85_005478 [Meristemomyces frigidus]